jgi:hypothetical protein
MLTLLAMPALCAEPGDAAKSDAAKPKAAPTAAEAEDGTVLTPFGRVKKQAPAPKPQPRPGAAASMVTVDVADGVATFKRQTPFGVQSWTRPMDQLSADEKKLLDESREAAAPTAKESVAPPAKPEAKKKPELVILEPR